MPSCSPQVPSRLEPTGDALRVSYAKSSSSPRSGFPPKRLPRSRRVPSAMTTVSARRSLAGAPPSSRLAHDAALLCLHPIRSDRRLRRVPSQCRRASAEPRDPSDRSLPRSIPARADRPLRVILMGLRVAEIDEHAVAHVFRDEATKTADRRCTIDCVPYGQGAASCRATTPASSSATRTARPLANFYFENEPGRRAAASS